MVAEAYAVNKASTEEDEMMATVPGAMGNEPKQCPKVAESESDEREDGGLTKTLLRVVGGR